jgi:hypothetical protein
MSVEIRSSRRRTPGDVVKLASLSGTAGALGFVGAVRPANAMVSLLP